MKTENIKIMRRMAPKRAVQELVEMREDPGPYPSRPKTRSECENGCRPCPFVSCRYNLFIDVTKAGSIVYNAAKLEDMKETCALDVAARGGVTLEEIGESLGCTRERVRQIAAAALEKTKEILEEEL